MFCPNCGEKVRDNAAICSVCGSTLRKKQELPPAYDSSRATGGRIFLVLMFPFLGICFWATHRKKAPRAAKTYLIIGILMWILSALTDWMIIGMMMNL